LLLLNINHKKQPSAHRPGAEEHEKSNNDQLPPASMKARWETLTRSWTAAVASPQFVKAGITIGHLRQALVVARELSFQKSIIT